MRIWSILLIKSVVYILVEVSFIYLYYNTYECYINETYTNCSSWYDLLMPCGGLCPRPTFHAWVTIIHAICPGRTEKSRNFDPSKPIPTGRRFSRKICFVPESLWPVKCTAFGDFWTGQIAIKTIITRSSNPSHVYCIYLTPVQRCGEVFRQYLATAKGITICKKLFNFITKAQ